MATEPLPVPLRPEALAAEPPPVLGGGMGSGPLPVFGKHGGILPGQVALVLTSPVPSMGIPTWE